MDGMGAPYRNADHVGSELGTKAAIALAERHGENAARTGEVVVDLWVAQAREIAVGDRVRIGEGATATDVRVVGLVESPSVVAQASVYVTWPQLLQWHDHLHLGSVAVRGE